MNGREVVVVEAVRTPIGRGKRDVGYYRDVHPSTLLAAVYTEVLARSGIDAAEVDQVVTGCAQQLGEQGFNIGRTAWLEAGLPYEVPATTVDLQCGSAQHAVNIAGAQIAAGVADAVVAAGVEHMGRIPMFVARQWEDEIGSPWTPGLLDRYTLTDQGLSAELIAERWDLSREELDAVALRSQQRAARATAEGRFARELAPVAVDGGTPAADQGIRPETTAESLAGLRPAFREDGKLTAGNSSQISDGAAAVLLMARERAAALGLRSRARILDQVTVGVDPVLMLTGPIPATRKILERNGMTIGDLDLVEINEAFASVVAAWELELAPDPERVNVNGGAIALGHPLGSTGARLMATLVHELERSDSEHGLVTMCCGGGLGTATLIQRV